MSLSQLKSVKTRLGRLVFLDFTSSDLVSAHKHLGQEVQPQVYKILQHKLDEMDEDLLIVQIRQVRRCYSILGDRSTSLELNPSLRSALAEYLRCLAAWADGARLEDFSYPELSKITVDGKPVSSLDLALLLQHDNTGCQTGLYRQADGSVILWHAEEDGDKAGDRFDQLRIASLQVKTSHAEDGTPENVILHAFIYPDLLPGPAFGWRSDGFIQAIDSLLLKQDLLETDGVLANAASWVTLRLGSQVNPEEVLQAMQPYYDGLALNAVYLKHGQVQSSKHQFFVDRVIPEALPEDPGSYLFQVNVFTGSHDPNLLKLERLPAEHRIVFEDRVRRTRRMLRRINSNPPSPENGMEAFFKIMTSRSGGDWAYSNPDVKAYFLGKISAHGMEIWLGNGPPVPSEDPLKFEIPQAA